MVSAQTLSQINPIPSQNKYGLRSLTRSIPENKLTYALNHVVQPMRHFTCGDHITQRERFRQSGALLGASARGLILFSLLPD
jgi:hypothetical protein